jgi:hypothetical protein
MADHRILVYGSNGNQYSSELEHSIPYIPREDKEDSHTELRSVYRHRIDASALRTNRAMRILRFGDLWKEIVYTSRRGLLLRGD